MAVSQTAKRIKKSDPVIALAVAELFRVERGASEFQDGGEYGGIPNGKLIAAPQSQRRDD
jgi:hypothetical protein